MTSFVLAGILMTALAVGFVVTPLLRKTNEPGAGIAATITTLVLPAAILLLYLSASNFSWNPPQTAPGSGSGGMSDPGTPGMSEAVAGLEDRLRREPNDIEGWLLLARAYTQMRQFPDAESAYRAALELGAGSEATLGLAEIAILTDRMNLSGVAGEMVESVLLAEPDNAKALFYGGMVAGARNDMPTLKKRWQHLLELSPPPEIRRIIEAQLADLGSVGTVGQQATDERGRIDVRISVAEELTVAIQPGAMLFLVAREPGRAGPPVAVVRENAANLPMTVRITDANSMLPGRSISTLDRVHLIARIANGGEPMAQPGDISGEQIISIIDARADTVNIHMDQVLQ